MTRFNQRHSPASSTTSPVRSTGARATTHEGGQGWLRDARSELFLLAVTNMVGTSTFYESGGERDDRFTQLVRQLAVEDPEWTAGLLGWLRTDGNLRTASLVGAAEFTRGRLDAEAHGHSRQVVASVLRRADEPGELLAYWTSRYGRSIPKPIKRGVQDSLGRLYTERSLLKYDTDSRGFRFADVIELVHPSPVASWQGELFRYAIDRRHRRDVPVPEALRLLRSRAELAALPVEGRRAVLVRSDAVEVLRDAGMTWEALAGWTQGPMDATAWEAVIPSMGYMACLRNLRNFDQAGVSRKLSDRVAARLSSPEEVAQSRQFPFRFLAAYQQVKSLRWAEPLEQALQHALGNVPWLRGRTLVLVDRSGSMFGGISGSTQLNRADSAAIFGAAVAVRADEADLVEFGTTSRRVRLKRREPLLRVLERFTSLGGTNTAEAVRQHYRGHDRVVIVTDEQAMADRRDPTEQIPASVPVYTWNLAGYRVGHGPSGTANRHTFGGLSDAAFRLVPLIESGQSATWPWLVDEKSPKRPAPAGLGRRKG